MFLQDKIKEAARIWRDGLYVLVPLFSGVLLEREEIYWKILDFLCCSYSETCSSVYIACMHIIRKLIYYLYLSI